MPDELAEGALAFGDGADQALNQAGPLTLGGGLATGQPPRGRQQLGQHNLLQSAAGQIVKLLQEHPELGMAVRAPMGTSGIIVPPATPPGFRVTPRVGQQGMQSAAQVGRLRGSGSGVAATGYDAEIANSNQPPVPGQPKIDERWDRLRGTGQPASLFERRLAGVLDRFREVPEGPLSMPQKQALMRDAQTINEMVSNHLPQLLRSGAFQRDEALRVGDMMRELQQITLTLVPRLE